MPQHLDAREEQIGRSDQLDDRECGRGRHQQRRQADHGAEHVNQTAAADPDRGRQPAAPAELDAAPDDIGGVRSRRDVKQQAGEDEKPEFVDPERLADHFDPFLCNSLLTIR